MNSIGIYCQGVFIHISNKSPLTLPLLTQSAPTLSHWQGDVICVANSNYAANPKLVQAQYKSLEDGSAQRHFQNLIAKKFENSISVLKLLPNGKDKLAAIDFFKSGIIELSAKKTIPNDKLLGIEGRAAALR